MSNLLLDLYKKMFMIREAENKIRQEYKNDEMKTPMHMSMGSEAIAVGIITALGHHAQVWGTYRSHAIYLARTGDLSGFFGEFYGKSTGPGKGKAGSMHLADPSKGVMMTSAVVGTSIPPATGAAFTSKILKDGKINVTFFGDGAADEGAFWESINLACAFKLPLIFVCEDNGLAIHTPAVIRRGYDSITKILSQYNNLLVLEYDGTDVKTIYDLTIFSLRHLDIGPVFISLKYYRYLEHVGVNDDFHPSYRNRDEFNEWKKIDPIDLLRQRLIEADLEDRIVEIENDLIKKIKTAVEAAKDAPFPEPDELYTEVYDG